jgi:hypothetical protein
LDRTPTAAGIGQVMIVHLDDDPGTAPAAVIAASTITITITHAGRNDPPRADPLGALLHALTADGWDIDDDVTARGAERLVIMPADHAARHAMQTSTDIAQEVRR